MNIDEALCAFLKGLSTAAGVRVFPDKAPQAGPWPAIVFHRISGTGDHTHQGPSEYREARFTLDYIAKKKAEVSAIEDQVRLALDGYRGSMGGAAGPEVDGAFLDDQGRDDYDDELETFVRMHDVVIEYGPPAS